MNDGEAIAGVPAVSPSNPRDLTELEASRRTMVDRMSIRIAWYVTVYRLAKSELTE